MATVLAYRFREARSRMPYHSKWEYLPTEAINPDTLAIDQMAAIDVIDQMVAEDRKVVAAVQKERVRIAHGVEIITTALKKGGRLFLVGAGTSGRLSIVRRRKCRHVRHRRARAGHHGGRSGSRLQSSRAWETTSKRRARCVPRLRIGKRDVVIGVSASGITQFVRGALTGARKKNARIIFVTCWPATELQNYVDLVIAPAVGPEIIAVHAARPHRHEDGAEHAPRSR